MPAVITRLVTMRASAEAAHAVSGNRVRSASGAQVGEGQQHHQAGGLVGVAGVVLRQHRVGDGEADQRGDRVGDLNQVEPPAPQPGMARGGGFVVSVTNVAAKLRTAVRSMPQA